MYDLLIKNAQIVCPDGMISGELAVQDGVIQAIGEGLGAAQKVVDAAGDVVFPGVIDVHVHLNEPGNAEWEGFTTGTHLLAAGGVTTYFDMPLNANPPTINKAALQLKKQLASEKSRITPYFWGGLVHDNVAELEAMSADVIGFKAFLSNSGFTPFAAVQQESLLAGMREIARLGKILALHAESDELTQFLQQQKIAAGLLTPQDYAESRPIVAEVEAVNRALYFGELTGCALHFVHISSAEAIRLIQAAKKRGQDVSVETCPHYFRFTEEMLERGVLAKCAPPLRNEATRRELIERLLAGDIDIIASDHSPCPPHMKDLTNKHFFEAWGGINGGQFTLQATLALCDEYNVPYEQAAKWLSENPAKRFGLTNRGKLAVGYAADFTIVTRKPYTVTQENHFAKHKATIYEGETFPHTIVATYCAGECKYEQEMSMI
ncbi:MAG: allantoinase AllB [Solibacillus sp.]